MRKTLVIAVLLVAAPAMAETVQVMENGHLYTYLCTATGTTVTCSDTSIEAGDPTGRGAELMAAGWGHTPREKCESDREAKAEANERREQAEALAFAKYEARMRKAGKKVKPRIPPPMAVDWEPSCRELFPDPPPLNSLF